VVGHGSGLDVSGQRGAAALAVTAMTLAARSLRVRFIAGTPWVRGRVSGGVE
jgi:hypothetical protein